MLAKLRRLRPYGYRYKQEQQQIENWLALIREAARKSPALALEVAECARLIKGYGDTHARGLANYRAIEERVIRPALAGQIAPARAVDALASARTAALVDPEGEGLAKCLADDRRAGDAHRGGVGSPLLFPVMPGLVPGIPLSRARHCLPKRPDRIAVSSVVTPRPVG